MKCALVLSGGGLFGAWQVGAWSVLREHIRFDVVIGASIGSLNGWAIAGGATPGELSAKWLEAADRGSLRFRIPRNPLNGVIEPRQIEGFIRDLHTSFQPTMECYTVMTDLIRLRPRLVEAKSVEWRHLAASCALLGLLPQQRIESILYTDGGLLGSLPLWAAHQCQATHVVGLNVMPKMPWAVRAVLKPIVKMKGLQQRPARESTVVLSPSTMLGRWQQGLRFERSHIVRWLEQGKTDAAAAIRSKNISFADCFDA